MMITPMIPCCSCCTTATATTRGCTSDTHHKSHFHHHRHQSVFIQNTNKSDFNEELMKNENSQIDQIFSIFFALAKKGRRRNNKRKDLRDTKMPSTTTTFFFSFARSLLPLSYSRRRLRREASMGSPSLSFVSSEKNTSYASFSSSSSSGAATRGRRKSRFRVTTTAVTNTNNNNNNDREGEEEEEEEGEEATTITTTTTTTTPSPFIIKKIERKQRGACYGCGVKIQTVSPSAVGFVSELDYETKKKNKQLDLLLCLRCSNLSNGQMINAVVGQGGQKIETGLITPEELRETLKDIRGKKALVVKIVDLTDFHGSFLPKIRDLVGSNPILLVVTKCDVIGKGFAMENNESLIEYVIEECAKKKLTLAGDPIFVAARKPGSSRSNSSVGNDTTAPGTRGIRGEDLNGMRAAVLTTIRERRGRDVYVVGSANVGKSTFVREFTKVLRTEMGNYFAPSKRLPTASSMPGTTLGVIPIKAFEDKKSLYDTPGVFLHHRVNSLLNGEQMKSLKLGGDLKVYRAPVSQQDGSSSTSNVNSSNNNSEKLKNVSFDWNGLVRLDILDAPETDDLNTVNVSFYGPKKMRIFKSTIDDMQKHADGGDKTCLFDESAPTREFYQSLPSLRVSREVEISLDDYKGKDLSISGLGGWIRVVRERNHTKYTNSPGAKGSITVRVWSLPGVEVFVRDVMPI